MAFVAVAAAVVSAVAAESSAQAQSKNAAYQSQVSAMNAKIASQNANYETALGEQKATQQGEQNRAQLGAIKAAQGASGLDVNTGSNLLTRESGSEIGMTNVLQTKTDASRQAYNYQTQSTNLMAESGLQATESSQFNTAGYLSAGSSLLGGASQAATQYNKFGGMFTLGNS